MITPGPATRVFLSAGPTDMRTGFDGLSQLVRGRLEADPLSGHLFVFSNRRRNRLKILCFDGSGLWICTKRLERGQFSWPALEPGRDKVSLSGEELALLCGGIDLERTRMKNWWRRAA